MQDEIVVVGRPTRPVNDEYDFEPRKPVAPGPSIPATCMRVLSTSAECPGVCEGLQEDGSCLCDIVRHCQVAGVPVRFQINERTLAWEFVGEQQ